MATEVSAIRPVTVAFALAVATIAPARGGEVAPRLGGGAPMRIVELSRTLETQVYQLFVALSRQPGAAESLLLHAHNLLGATKSFADIARDPEENAEFISLSLSLLAREASLLEPLLPEAPRANLWPAISSTIATVAEMVGGMAVSPSSTEDDPSQPRIEITNDGWHGNILDRSLRVSGRMEGIDLKSCDIVITDAQNRIVWSQRDQIGEIEAYYLARPASRARRVTIKLSIRIPSDALTDGGNFITFRLVDSEGRQAFDTVSAGG